MDGHEIDGSVPQTFERYSDFLAGVTEEYL
jgi:hypothetical protein